MAANDVRCKPGIGLAFARSVFRHPYFLHDIIVICLSGDEKANVLLSKLLHLGDTLCQIFDLEI